MAKLIAQFDKTLAKLRVGFKNCLTDAMLNGLNESQKGLVRDEALSFWRTVNAYGCGVVSTCLAAFAYGLYRAGSVVADIATACQNYVLFGGSHIRAC